MSKTGKILLITGGVLVVFFLIAIIGIALLAESLGKPDVPNNSVLVLNVSGELPDYSAEDPMAKVFGMESPQSFSSLMTQMRKAKVDSRIGAVLLNVNFPGIGWGKADELRAAIADLRASGKPVYAFMEIGMNKEYYIASAAEKVFLAPAGDIYINGFAAEVTFYRGSLDKLGIEPEVIAIGKYKNAPDQFTRKEMSEAHAEVMNAIIDEYYQRFINGIAESRKKSPADVKAMIDNAPYHAPEAKQLGLIDEAAYRDQVYDELKNRLGYKEGDKIRTVSGSSYKEISSDSLGLNNGERVAVVYASGAINVGRSSRSAFGGESLGSDTLVKAINDAAEDTTIKAIVLRVDSPGGSALASDLMWHAIENAKAKKPVVVSMADVAASGGYYIACNANKIVAEPSTLTGSIGVFMGKPSLKGFNDWLGISNQYVIRGKNAGIFRTGDKWTEDEKKKMEEQTNKIYWDDFVPKVAKGRGKTNEDVNTIAQGRVWTGAQAKERGLVDEIGGLEKSIEIAKQLANLPADKDVRRVVFPEPRTFFEEYFGGGSEDSTFAQSKDRQAQEALVKALPADMRRALRYAELFDQMRNGEAMLMLPYEFEIK
ncbi:MAG TPA: signal peptide peptidase SppA [Pyrinomonadaceae bacterium]